MASEEEVEQLKAELANLKREVAARALANEIAKAALAPPVREWHRVVYFTKGRRNPSMIVGQDGEGWQSREECGTGYYVVEDGVVVAIVDPAGHPLPHGEPSHEHKVGEILRTSPFA